jgi:hypothetical protein
MGMSSADTELRASIEIRSFEGRLFEGGAVLELSGTVDVSNPGRT